MANMMGYNRANAEALIMKKCARDGIKPSLVSFCSSIGFAPDYLSHAGVNGKISADRAEQLAKILRCDVSKFTFKLYDSPAKSVPPKKHRIGEQKEEMVDYAGNIARELIAQKGLTESDISKKLGLSPSYISTSRHNSRIRKPVAIKLSEFLECPLETIASAENKDIEIITLFEQQQEEKTEPTQNDVDDVKMSEFESMFLNLFSKQVEETMAIRCLMEELVKTWK